MDTKQSINYALRVIGENGLEGIDISADSAKDGLSILLGGKPVRQISDSRLLTELKRQNLIEISQSSEKYHFVVSLAGAYRLEKLIVSGLSIDISQKWDGKWRAVSFNVPLNRSRQRTVFTDHLSKLGFTRLHKSLWVYPYPCFEAVTQIASYYNLLRYLHMMEINEFDTISTSQLVRQFGSILKN